MSAPDVRRKREFDINDPAYLHKCDACGADIHTLRDNYFCLVKGAIGGSYEADICSACAKRLVPCTS